MVGESPPNRPILHQEQGFIGGDGTKEVAIIVPIVNVASPDGPVDVGCAKEVGDSLTRTVPVVCHGIDALVAVLR
jgi:hypothetical protein